MSDWQVNRRDFLRLSGLTAAGVLASACGAGQAGAPAAATSAPSGAATAPAATAAAGAAAAGTVKDVAREKTLILSFGGANSQFQDTGSGNAYATGASHQMGSAALWEPLYYYSAFADEYTPWLATGYKYNADYTELTINIRDGVLWSDGEPFTANDVVFTLNMLKDNAPLLTDSTPVKTWVKEATAVDNATVKITFTEPQPRFMFRYLMFKYDTGIVIVPQHIYKDVKDVAGFQFYDPAKGYPVCTGPYKITQWTPTQKFHDLREDWWGVKTGFAELPVIERILVIPAGNDTTMAQMNINNQIDSSLDLRATVIKQVVDGNPKIITHTLRELPYGYMDWWPTSFWFNCDVPPFNTKEMRWAISYSIDREQMLQVALGGSGILTELPFPDYPAVHPFFEAAKDLLAKYPTNEFNLDKAAALMQGQGYAKGSDGMWAKDGKKVDALIYGFPIFGDIGPVLAEQLRKGGFNADYTMPADSGTKMADGTAKILLYGHGGTIIDPWTTMDMYTSKYYQPQGTPAAYYSRWKNPQYDDILNQMAAVPSDSPGYTDLYLKAMAIWLDELPDAPIQQWLHRIPMNQTYWVNWPTKDNPYINGAFWHLTFPLMLRKLKQAS